MSKTVSIPGKPDTPALDALESLSGVVEDMTNQAMRREKSFDSLVLERFGNKVSPDDIRDRMDAVRALD